MTITVLRCVRSKLIGKGFRGILTSAAATDLCRYGGGRFLGLPTHRSASGGEKTTLKKAAAKGCFSEPKRRRKA